MAVSFQLHHAPHRSQLGAWARQMVLYKQLRGEVWNPLQIATSTAAASPFPAGTESSACPQTLCLQLEGAQREGTQPQARGQSPGWQLQLMAAMPRGSRCPFPRAGWECWHQVKRGDPLAGCPGTAFDVTKELCSPRGTSWGRVQLWATPSGSSIPWEPEGGTQSIAPNLLLQKEACQALSCSLPLHSPALHLPSC